MQEVELGADDRVVTAGPKGPHDIRRRDARPGLSRPQRVGTSRRRWPSVRTAGCMAYAPDTGADRSIPTRTRCGCWTPRRTNPRPSSVAPCPGCVVIGALDFSADGKRLVAGLSSFNSGANSGVQVWDVTHPARPVRTVDADGVKLRVALSPRGDTVYAATRGPDVLRAYDVASGRLLAKHGVPYVSDRTPPLVLSPDGSLLATSHRDGVAVYNAKTLRPRFILPGQDDGVSALAFSPDGSRLAAGFTSGTTIVWEVAHQRPVRTLHGHSQPVEDVAFSLDGRRLDTVSTDGQLLTWDVAGSGTFPAARQFRENPRAEKPPSRLPTAAPSPTWRTGQALDHLLREPRADAVPRRGLGPSDPASPDLAWGGPPRGVGLEPGLPGVRLLTADSSTSPAAARCSTTSRCGIAATGSADAHGCRCRGGPGEVHPGRQADGPGLGAGETRKPHDRGPRDPSADRGAHPGQGAVQSRPTAWAPTAARSTAGGGMTAWR